MRQHRLVNVFDEVLGIECSLCQAINDGGKRLVHAERIDGLTVIQNQDYCDECLDALARLVIAHADEDDIDQWERLIYERKNAQWSERSPLDG